MAVVINEFEVLTDAGGAARTDAGAAAAAEGVPPEPPKPQDLQPVLRAIAQQALRVWAH